MNDQKTAYFIDEIRGRILIQRGKIVDGMKLLGEVVDTNKSTNMEMGRLCADFAELLFENSLFERAKGVMLKAFDIFKSVKDKHRFTFNTSVNAICEKEQVKIMEKY